MKELANVVAFQKIDAGWVYIVAMPGQEMEFRAMLNMSDISMSQAVALLA